MQVGRLMTGVQLADRRCITGYAVIQSTVVGLRGIFGPQISVGLLALGFADTTVFLLSAGVMGAAWLLFGLVHAPAPAASEKAMRQKLRSRWPFRTRIPRV